MKRNHVCYVHIVIIAIIVLRSRQCRLLQTFLVRLVLSVHVDRFPFILPIVRPRILLFVVRDVVAVHAVVLAVRPYDVRNLDYLGILRQQLLILRPLKRQPPRRCRANNFTPLHRVLLVLVYNHRHLVLAVGHRGRRAPARALVQSRPRRHVRAFALAETLRAEQRRTALRRRGDDGRVRILAAGQTRLRDIAAGEAVRLFHAVAVQHVVR